MGRSQESFGKKEVRKKKEKKRKEKEKRRMERKDNEKSGSLDDMIAYVDANGNIVDTPPDPEEQAEIELDDIEVSVPKSEKQKVDSEFVGVVTNFNNSKGFGFIRESNTREDVFVHVNNTIDDISEGSKVVFKKERGQKGPIAVDVKLLK